MKTWFLFVIVASVAASPALAQQPSSLPPLITTTGAAQIRVVPDLADLYFEVEVRNSDLVVARKQQAERAVKVLAVLRAAGITEAELQSSQVQIAPDYSDRRQETEKVRFYRVSQTICGTLHDLKKISDVTSDAITAGASGVHEASLRTSELRKYRNEARAQAIHAAKEKAVALATELGAKIGKPYTITEGAYESRSNINNTVQTPATAEDQSTEDTSSTFALGTISVSASVTVAFILE